jgi:uncharacterized protein YkwD
MNKIFFIFVAFAASAPLLALAGEDPCYDMAPEACETFSLTNVERLKASLPALAYSPTCFAMAQEQSSDMASRGYFDHQRPVFPDRPAEDFPHRAARFGLENGVGENIAQAKTPERALELWMNSPGHRRNILNPRFHAFGVGYQNGLFTQTFSN